jgi:hypothetical protein
MNGVLSGGWSFVWAAYLISAAILAGYTARTIAAYRRERS